MEDKTKKHKILPFAEYVLSLDDEDAKILKREMELRGGFSAASTSRYLNGGVRPDLLKRREIAAVIRKHSGNKNWTGDGLFPVEFYK